MSQQEARFADVGICRDFLSFSVQSCGGPLTKIAERMYAGRLVNARDERDTLFYIPPDTMVKIETKKTSVSA